MARIDQINELLHGQLADLINREVRLDGGLITVTDVDCSPNLKVTKIAISVLPDKYYGTVLKELRKRSKLFSGILKKKLNLKFIPKIHWVIDPTEKYAAKLDEVFAQIQEEDEENRK